MRNFDSKATDMGEETISKLLIKLSLPATLGMLVMASYNIIDTIFVGMLGGRALAALSIAFPVQMLLGAFGIGTGVGAGSLIARSLGAGKEEDAAATAGQVIILSILFGFISAVAGYFFLEPLLRFFGATPDIMPFAIEYMSVILYGGIFFFLIMILNNTIRSEGNAMLPMRVMVSSALLNIALDYLLIIVMDMGIQGAAIATILAKIIGVIILLWYYFTGKGRFHIKLTDLKPKWNTIAEIYKVGVPAMFMQLSNNVAIVIANNILATFGYVPIAVMGLIIRFQMFALMPVIGVAQGLLPIIGFNYGAQKYPRIREAMKKGIMAGTIFVTFIGICLFAFPEFFLRIFTSESEIITVGIEAIRIIVIMFPLVSIQTISIVFFQAIGKGKPSLFLSLLRQFFLYVPLLLVFSNIIGLTGVWLAMPVADFIAFFITIFMVSKEMNLQGIPILARTDHGDGD